LGDFLDAVAGSKTVQNIRVTRNSTCCKDVTPVLLRGKLTQEESSMFSGPSCVAANLVTLLSLYKTWQHPLQRFTVNDHLHEMMNVLISLSYAVTLVYFNSLFE